MLDVAHEAAYVCNRHRRVRPASARQLLEDDDHRADRNHVAGQSQAPIRHAERKRCRDPLRALQARGVVDDPSARIGKRVAKG
jgi:hypothetical protein